jgi:hypothetical protein
VLLQVRSSDGGRTWDAPLPILARPDWTCLGLAGLRLADDRLLGFAGYLRSQAAARMADIFQESSTHLTQSRDGGRTWSELGPALGWDAGLLEVYGQGSPIRTAEGWLFSCCVLPDATGEWYAAAFVLDPQIGVPEAPRVIAKAEGLQYSDVDLVRAADGAIVGVVREDTPPGYAMYGVRSVDDGVTWSEPWRLTIRGASQAVTRLADGTIACFYRDREEGRPGLSVAVSSDGGTTYRFVGQVHVGRGPFLGFPAIGEPAPSELGVLYCTAIVDGESELRFARIRDRTA